MPNWSSLKLNIKKWVQIGLTAIVWLVEQIANFLIFISSSFFRFLVTSYFWFTILCGTIYALLFYVLPIFVPPINTNFFDTFSNIFGLNRQKFDVNFYYSSSTFIGAFIPVSLTMYFFAYRAQHSVSGRNLLIRNYYFLAFLSSSLLTVAYGKHLGNLFTKLPIPPIPQELAILYSRASIYIFLLMLSALFLIPMVQSLLRSTSMRFTLDDMIRQTKFAIDTIVLSPWKRQRKHLFTDLHVYSETIYQSLETAIEKNMNDIFFTYYDAWVRVLADLQQNTLNILYSKVKSEVIIQKEKDEFLKLYGSILQNQIKMVMTLVKNHRIDDAKNGIVTFLDLKPHIDQLKMIYFDAVLSLMVSAYDNKTLGIRPLLNGIEARFVADIELKDIYKWLLVKTVKENDVKNLTSAVYSLLKSTQRIQALANPVDDKTGLIHRMKSAIVKNEVTKTSGQLFEKSTILFCEIVLEAAIKSVELAHYSCTGFLVKFLVTNIKSDTLQQAYNNVQQRFNPNVLTYLETSDKVSVNINGSTFDYCNKKLTLILFGQQKYVVKSKLQLAFKPDSFIDISTLDCDWLEYLFNKIDKAKSKYGLLFLEDDKFAKELKEEVYFLIRSNNKRSE